MGDSFRDLPSLRAYFCPGFDGTNTHVCRNLDNVANPRFLELVWTQTLFTRFNSDLTQIYEDKNWPFKQLF